MNFWGGRGNPLEGLDPVEQYSALQWGREPKRVREIEVPHMRRRQTVVLLGKLRAVHLEDGRILRAPRPYPWLVVGSDDNRLYFAGGSLEKIAKGRKWGFPGHKAWSIQIDYDSHKGQREGTKVPVYYYHEHEEPFPRLVIADDGMPLYRGGGYTVAPEGITG